MMISFESLREFQRKEKYEKGLTELPNGFYPQCSISLKSMEEKAKDTSGILELEGMKKTLEDVLEMRERKILLMALHSARGASAPINLLPEEKKFFDNLLSNIIGLRKDLLDDIMQGRLKVPKEEIKQKLPQRPPQKSMYKEKIIEKKPESIKTEYIEPVKPQVKAEVKEPTQTSLPEESKEKRLKNGELPLTQAGRMKVTFLKELPAFMATDSKAYGPVKPGDILDLPEDVAQFLINKKDAKKA